MLSVALTTMGNIGAVVAVYGCSCDVALISESGLLAVVFVLEKSEKK